MRVAASVYTDLGYVNSRQFFYTIAWKICCIKLQIKKLYDPSKLEKLSDGHNNTYPKHKSLYQGKIWILFK